jgi:hypothetical protein
MKLKILLPIIFNLFAFGIPKHISGPVEVYVSPQGRPNAAGTRTDPKSLEIVCSNRDLPPGATVYLLQGTYRIAAQSVPNIGWKGAPGAPIVMRSAPGQWAVIDGRLDVAGARYVTLRDFEVTRTEDQNKLDPHWWRLPIKERPSYSGKDARLEFKMGGDLIELYESEGVRLINLYLHDNISGGGIGAWNPALNTLVYGCLIIRNGWEDKVRGHGHGCYIQNGWPADHRGGSKKIFRHNIAAYNQSTGMKSYGQNPDVRGTYFEGNVFFGNGLRTGTNGSANFLCGTTNGLLDDVVLRGNFFYQPDRTTGDVGGTVYLGWGGNNKGRCIFTGNYVFGGGSEALLAQHWQSFTFTGNTLYDDKCLFSVNDGNESLKNWKWDDNTYYDPGQPKPIRGPQGPVSFSEWREQTGFDQTSRWIPNKPQGLQSFIIPNEYDPARALVVVCNWERKDQVELDLSSFLKKGDRFAIYHSLNFRGQPVAEGIYRGGLIKVRMRSDEWIGNEFQALVVNLTR